MNLRIEILHESSRHSQAVMASLGRRLLGLSCLLFGLRLLRSGLFNLFGGDLLQFGNFFGGGVTVGGSLLRSLVSLAFDSLLLGSIAVLCGLLGLAVGSLSCFSCLFLSCFGSLFLSGSFGRLLNKRKTTNLY